MDIEVDEAARVLRMYARDRGRGIRNLEQILRGEYQSKTGLGKGLLGVKRLAQRFDVKTGAQGTEIRVEVGW
jgi:serine/threonine-protein kinase RsbT